MQGNVPERIRKAQASLTPSERRIADVLSDSNLMMGLENVATLAARAQVSGPTVIRFANKLGFEGFPQLQSALRDDLRERLASPLDHYAQAKVAAPKDREPPASAATRVFNAGIAKTLGRVSAATLKEASAQLLNESRTVHLVGGRFTQHIAAMLWGHLHQLRPNTRLLQPGVVSLQEQALDFGRSDLLVVFDIRRYQPDIIELARRARAQRATLMLITDPLLSPIARWAKYLFTCELDSPSPHHSLVPCLAFIETMVAELNRQGGERGRERIGQLESLQVDVESGREIADEPASKRTRSRRSN